MCVIVWVAQLVCKGIQEEVSAFGVKIASHPLEYIHGRGVHDWRGARLNLLLRLYCLQTISEREVAIQLILHILAAQRFAGGTQTWMPT